MTIHDNTQTLIHNSPVKNEVKYVGVTITKNITNRETSNIQIVLQKNKKKV